MSISKIILNAKGEQDNYLSSNSQHTHFKNNITTHTNFSKILVEIEPNRIQNEDTTINFGETIDFSIDKSSNLLLNVTVRFTLEKWHNPKNIVPETLFGLIDYIEIVSNDRVLQRLSGTWMYIHYLMYVNKTKSDSRHVFEASRVSNQTQTSDNEYVLYLPIPFWFTKEYSSALPIFAMCYEKISINLKLKNFDEITKNGIPSDYIIRETKLLCEFAEVESYEKEQFLNNSLEYLIEQIEYYGPNKINNSQSYRTKIAIDNHYLVKEIIWICKEKNPDNINNYFNFWLNNDSVHKNDHFKYGSILLNGRVLNPKFPASYYRLIQRNQHYKSDFQVNEEFKSNCIYSYSFNLNPDEIKSSGFLSFNKYNNVHLDLQMTSLTNTKERELFVFVKRFNIIRIKNGQMNILAN